MDLPFMSIIKYWILYLACCMDKVGLSLKFRCRRNGVFVRPKTVFLFQWLKIIQEYLACGLESQGVRI